MEALTVDTTLEFLPAHFAIELAHAGFLVHLDRDGFLVVAEEASEDRGQGVRLEW